MPGTSFATGNNFTFEIAGAWNAPFELSGDGHIPQELMPVQFDSGHTVLWQVQGNQSGFDPPNGYYQDPLTGAYSGAPVEVYFADFSFAIFGLELGPQPPLGIVAYKFTDPFGRVISIVPPSFTGNNVGSFTLSFPVNEWVDFSFVTTPVPGIFRQKYLVVPAGSVFTIVYTNPGGTVTYTSAATPSDVTANIQGAQCGVHPSAIGAHARTAALTLSANGAPYNFSRTTGYSAPTIITNGVQALLAESATYDYTNGIAVTTTGGGRYALVSPGEFQRLPPGDVLGAAWVSAHGATFDAFQAKKVTLEGTIYGFGGGSYPNAPQNVDFYCRGSNPFSLVPCNPGCNFSYTQRAGSISEWIYNDVYSINEFGPIYANVDASINAVGDVADPLYGHDVTYNSFTVEHLASLVIDDFNNAVPGAWSSSGATITTTTYTAIAATAGGASGTYTYSGTKPTLEAYRFANIVLNTQVGANVPLNVKINGKTWATTSGPTPGADITRQIDLCCPTSQDSSASGSEDTAFPRTSGNNTGPAITDSQHGGVGAVKTFTIAGIPNGETVEVKSLTGVRTTEALLDSSLQSTGPYLPYSGLDSGGRLILANVDGHQGLEVLGNSNPGTTSQVDLTLTQLIAAINSFPGWNATTTSPSHVYYNNTQDANWLGAAANSGFLGKDVSALTTLQATSLFRTADTYPGDDAGNTLNFVVWERGELHGLTLDSSGQPVTGQAVTTSPNGGSGTSDSLAYFQCGTPWLLPGLTYTIVQSGDMGFACLRKKTRAIGSPTGGGKNPWNLETVTGQYYKVDVENGNAVFYGSDFSTPLPAWTSTSTITSTGDVTDPRIAMDHRGVLYVVYARTISGAVSVYTQSSFDFGASWTGEVSLPITDGFHPTLAVSDTGIVVRAAFVYNSGTSGPGTLWATIQFPGDANQSAPFQLLDNTGPPGVALAVADDTFHIQFAADTPQRWLLTCRLNSGSGTSDFQSWDFCNTWTLTT